jgi:hypothetical protein
MMHMVLLAQAVPVAPDLPAAPALERYLLEQPWPISLVLLALGVIVAISLNKRGQAVRGLIIGAAFVAACLVVIALARGIETMREQLTRQTLQVIGGTIDADQSFVRPLVADDLEVGTMHAEGFTLDRDRFMRVVAGFDVMGVRDWSASPRGAVIDGANTGRVDFAVRVAGRGGLYAGPTPSVWRFTWRQSADGQWRLTQLHCLSMFGQSVDANALRWANRILN